MDSKKLEAFVTIARTGSFCNAAAEMGYTQSGLTQMIGGLEKELQCKLLDRNYRGVTVSENGRILMPYVEQILADTKQLKIASEQLYETGLPKLRIGAFSSMANNWLPPVLKRFKENHPGVSISLRVGAENVPQWLADGEIDLAFVDESRKRDFKWIPVKEDEFVSVVPKSYKMPESEIIKLKDLVSYPFIMTELVELKSQIEQLPGIHINEGIQLSAADDATLLSMVEQGLGVTVLTRMCIKGHLTNVNICPIYPKLKRVLGIALPKNVTPLAKALISYIQNG